MQLLNLLKSAAEDANLHFIARKTAVRLQTFDEDGTVVLGVKGGWCGKEEEEEGKTG